MHLICYAVCLGRHHSRGSHRNLSGAIRLGLCANERIRATVADIFGLSQAMAPVYHQWHGACAGWRGDRVVIHGKRVVHTPWRISEHSCGIRHCRAVPVSLVHVLFVEATQPFKPSAIAGANRFSSCGFSCCLGCFLYYRELWWTRFLARVGCVGSIRFLEIGHYAESYAAVPNNVPARWSSLGCRAK